MISVLLVAATIAVNSVSQNQVTRTVTVNYTLSGEKAVVTLDTVTTNGAAMAAADLLNVAGDGNRLMDIGMHTLLWQPPESAGFGPFGANQVKVTLKAWSVDAPPDYMVIDLEFPERVRYYTCKEAIPGGIEDMRYKTDFLAMRRIPAAGVTWRMGTSKNVRPGNWGGSSSWRAGEQTHYVKLTSDFYLAVYELTRRHFYWLNNASFSVDNGEDSFASYVPNGDTWNLPMNSIQFCVMRGWFHNSNCGYLATLSDPYAEDTVFKFWPRDGHDILPAKYAGCSGANCTGSSPRTSVLRKARDRYGIDFDLPTEAEWEFACRAGTEKTLYNNTDLGPNNVLDPNLDEIAWYFFNSSNETYQCCVPRPVGLKKPNAYGLYDMLGNVAETCLDIYKDYPKSDVVEGDPKGAIPTTGQIRGLRILMRGGAFHSDSCYGPRSGARLSSSSGVKDQQSVGWGQAKVATGNDAALSKRADGFRFWAPCKAVK